jgi:hypothetical protein
MLAIAVSGERKSTCDDIALAPVGRHEDALAAVYGHEMRRFENEKMAVADERRKIEKNDSLSYEEKCEALSKIPEPQPPRTPFLRLEEPTYEGLFNSLNMGQPSIGLFSPEGRQFIGGHGMSNDARTRMMTGLSKLWDIGSAQRVRAKEITRISGRRLSISLAA